ncbi:hypothetical protein JCM8097_004010 [Rhodosporidiobolus ruineniae]
MSLAMISLGDVVRLLHGSYTHWEKAMSRADTLCFNSVAKHSSALLEKVEKQKWLVKAALPGKAAAALQAVETEVQYALEKVKLDISLVTSNKVQDVHYGVLDLNTKVDTLLWRQQQLLDLFLAQDQPQSSSPGRVDAVASSSSPSATSLALHSIDFPSRVCAFVRHYRETSLPPSLLLLHLYPPSDIYPDNPNFDILSLSETFDPHSPSDAPERGVPIWVRLPALMARVAGVETYTWTEGMPAPALPAMEQAGDRWTFRRSGYELDYAIWDAELKSGGRVRVMFDQAKEYSAARRMWG